MGHVVNSDRQYRLLQQRLDRQLTGAPDSPTSARRCCRLLFSPEEADLATKIPGPAHAAGRRFRGRWASRPTSWASGSMRMARRGLIFDLEHDGTRYFALAPVVIGFFEFTFMRARDDVPMAELAELFDQYMNENDRFARSVFAGQTQIGRSLVREEALPRGRPHGGPRLGAGQPDHPLGLGGGRLALRLPPQGEPPWQGLRPAPAVLPFVELRRRVDDPPGQRRTGHDRTRRCKILRQAKDAGPGPDGRQRPAQAGLHLQLLRLLLRHDRGDQGLRPPRARSSPATGSWTSTSPAARAAASAPRPARWEPFGQRKGESESTVKTQQAATRAVVDETLCLGCGVCHGACKPGGVA